MPEYTVEVRGEVRELYSVMADNEEDARANWTAGDLYYSESSSCDVYDVREEL